MTRITVDLNNNARVNLLLAFLRRLGAVEDIKINIEENGQPIGLDRVQEDDSRFEARVSQLIQDAIAGKLDAVLEGEMDEIDRELADWGEKTSAMLGIASDEDIVRLVNDARREEREKPIA